MRSACAPAILAVPCVLLALASCGREVATTTGDDDALVEPAPPDTGEPEPGPEAQTSRSLADEVESQAKLLEEAAAKLRADGRGLGTPARPERARPAAARAPGPDSAIQRPASAQPTRSQLSEKPAAHPSTPSGWAERRDGLVLELEESIHAWAMRGGSAPAAGLQLAALGAFSEAPTPTLSGLDLPENGRRGAEVLAQTLRDLAHRGSDALEPDVLAPALSRAATQLGHTPNPAPVTPAPAPPSFSGDPTLSGGLSLPTVALCVRVQSFADYEPLGTTTFLAGRGASFILYAEIDGLSSRAGAVPGGAPGVVSELIQDVELYNDADGLLAWRAPSHTVRDIARRARRDFYVVQRIDLPRTLTIGKYNLKVRVRDQGTGAQAEATTPISVVAGQTPG